MAKYLVLRPIEHNQKWYVPKDFKNPPATVMSGGHGGDIQVDTSGLIDLDDKEAAAFVDGHIPLDEKGKPLSEAEKKRRAAEAKKHAEDEAARLEKEAEERMQFEEWREEKKKKKEK